MSSDSSNLDIDSGTSKTAESALAAGKKRLAITWHPLLAVVFLVVVYVLAQFISGLAVAAYAGLHHWSQAQTDKLVGASIPLQFAYVAMVEVLSLAAVWWFLCKHAAGFRVIGLVRPKLQDILPSIAGFGAYFVMFAVLTVLLPMVVPSLNIDQQQQIGFENPHGLLHLILVFASLVILPAVTEEILLRGFLFGSLRSRMSFVYATLLTSAIFASAHLPEGGAAGPLWIGAIDTFVLSLVLCYLRERTGRLWAGIGVHAIKNSVAFLSLFIWHLH